jgi:hypothetical protein
VADRKGIDMDSVVRALSYTARRLWWTWYDLANQTVMLEWDWWPPRARIVALDPKRREQVTR